MFKSILVLESAWDSQKLKSKSVWPFICEFANASDLTAYHQVFTDLKSFRHWVKRFHMDKTVKGPKLLYLAAHGRNGRIYGLNCGINGKKITESLKKAKSIGYLHFGSCLFGTTDNLQQVLEQVRHIKWAAGYTESVPWTESTLFDITLWDRIAKRDDPKHKGRKDHTLAQELIADAPGIARNLGFTFYYRYGKAIRGFSSSASE